MDDNAFRFAFITDPQIGMNSPQGLRGPGSDKERLDSAIAYVNENDIDFAVFGGDQIHDQDNESTDEQLDVLEASLSELTVPYYGVSGNHDHGAPQETWKYLERGMPRRFAFAHKNTFFVGLDAQCLRGEFGEDHQRAENAYLEMEISQAPATCAHRFVVMHWPLISSHPNEEDTSWNMPNRRDVIDLFRRNKVSCVLSGHWHQDIDACWQGINLITSVGTSRPLQYPEEVAIKVITVFDEGWSVRRVVVEGEAMLKRET